MQRRSANCEASEVNYLREGEFMRTRVSRLQLKVLITEASKEARVSKVWALPPFNNNREP